MLVNYTLYNPSDIDIYIFEINFWLYAGGAYDITTYGSFYENSPENGIHVPAGGSADVSFTANLLWDRYDRDVRHIPLDRLTWLVSTKTNMYIPDFDVRTQQNFGYVPSGGGPF